MILIFMNFFLEFFFSLDHHILKEERGKKNIPTPFLQPPHPTLPMITHKPSPFHATQ